VCEETLRIEQLTDVREADGGLYIITWDGIQQFYQRTPFAPPLNRNIRPLRNNN
jgi:hypothetical protein